MSFLAGRKKAAVAAAGDGLVIALLPEAPPESGLEGTTAACFFAEGGGGGAKRPRDDADAGPGFDAFPALDLVEGAARDAAVSALPAWNKKTARRDDAEAMVFRGDDGGCVFFQDARRKYEFACGAAGLRLLAGLVRAPRGQGWGARRRRGCRADRPRRRRGYRADRPRSRGDAVTRPRGRGSRRRGGSRGRPSALRSRGPRSSSR